MNRPIRKNKKDAYDGDHNTVSAYDNMEHHAYLPKYDEDFGRPYADFEGAQINSIAQRRSKDAYDFDHNTVSPYDNLEHHAYLPKYDEDFGNPLAGFECAQLGSYAQKRINKNKRDMYDHDPTTASPYDAMEVHNHVDKYEKDQEAWGYPNDLAQVHHQRR